MTEKVKLTYDDILRMWNEYISQYEYALVDFSAQWCAPCHILDPILEKLVNDPKYKSKITFLRISDERTNARDTPEDLNIYLMDALGINAVPTVILYHRGKPIPIKKKDGKTITMLKGVQKEETYRKLLDQIINHNGGELILEYPED